MWLVVAVMVIRVVVMMIIIMGVAAILEDRRDFQGDIMILKLRPM